MRKRSVSEMLRLPTFLERYEYLALHGTVGESTFGFDRYINQQFYRSREWKSIRHAVIARDMGCDLGIEGREIYDKIIIHHMNPMIAEDIEDANDGILDPQYLVSVSHMTHNAIHYGDARILVRDFTPRAIGDTRLW